MARSLVMKNTVSTRGRAGGSCARTGTRTRSRPGRAGRGYAARRARCSTRRQAGEGVDLRGGRRSGQASRMMAAARRRTAAACGRCRRARRPPWSNSPARAEDVEVAVRDGVERPGVDRHRGELAPWPRARKNESPRVAVGALITLGTGVPPCSGGVLAVVLQHQVEPGSSRARQLERSCPFEVYCVGGVEEDQMPRRPPTGREAAEDDRRPPRRAPRDPRDRGGWGAGPRAPPCRCRRRPRARRGTAPPAPAPRNPQTDPGPTLFGGGPRMSKMASRTLPEVGRVPPARAGRPEPAPAQRAGDNPHVDGNITSLVCRDKAKAVTYNQARPSHGRPRRQLREPPARKDVSESRPVGQGRAPAGRPRVDLRPAGRSGRAGVHGAAQGAADTRPAASASSLLMRDTLEAASSLLGDHPSAAASRSRCRSCRPPRTSRTS